MACTQEKSFHRALESLTGGTGAVGGTMLAKRAMAGEESVGMQVDGHILKQGSALYVRYGVAQYGGEVELIDSEAPSLTIELYYLLQVTQERQLVITAGEELSDEGMHLIGGVVLVVRVEHLQQLLLRHDRIAEVMTEDAVLAFLIGSLPGDECIALPQEDNQPDE